MTTYKTKILGQLATLQDQCRQTKSASHICGEKNHKDSAQMYPLGPTRLANYEMSTLKAA
jgi:hypothetical protein